MNEPDAVVVLLAREIERDAQAAGAAAQSARASDEARRALGESAPFDDWLVRRAQWLVARASPHGLLDSATRLTTGWRGLAAVLVALAFALGAASDAIGPAQRVNILAPPLLALLAWNLAVYVVLALRALARRRPASEDGVLRRALAALLARVRRVGATTPAHDEAAATYARFARAWMQSSGAIWSPRIAAAMHAAAAALVAGALCSMYLRGLALEYRAGWESTFLDAAAVHAVLGAVLGPASRLTGIALPDVGELAALRFGAGSGESAARWIHLYAITLVLAVIVPRLVLALMGGLRARRLTRRFPLPLDDAYFAKLRRAWSAARLRVQVLPYSYRLADTQVAALRATLEDALAAQVDLAVLDSAPLGAEDELDRWIGVAPSEGDPPPTLVVLFALAATPEREHHGALLRALRQQHANRPVVVVVDESGFRRRLHGAADDATRVDARRQAWRAVLDTEGATPLFVDLDGGDASAHAGNSARMDAPPGATGQRAS